MSTDIVEAASFGLIALVLAASGIASAVVKRTFHSVMFLGVFLVSVAALYVLLGSPLVGIIQVLVYVGGILTLFVFAVMFVAGDEAGEAAEPERRREPRSHAWTVLAGFLVAAAILYIAVTYVVDANHAAAGLAGGHYQESADGKTKTWVAGNLALAVGFGAGLLFIGLLAVAGLLAFLGVRHAITQWSGTRLFGTALAAVLFATLAAIVVGAQPCWPQLACVDANANWGTGAATDANVDAANALDTVVRGLFTTQAVALLILGVLLTAVMIGALVLARPLGAPADEERYAHITRDQLRESQLASDVSLHTGPPAPPARAPHPPAAAAGPTTGPEVAP